MNDSSAFGEATRMQHIADSQRKLSHTPGPVVQRGSTVLMPTAGGLYDGKAINYGRGGLATQQALCEALAELEQGEKALLYPSGLAAITGVLMAMVSAGDDILISEASYNPTRRFLDGNFARLGVTATYYPADASAGEIAALVTPRTRLIYLESPASLTFEMQDVPGIARMAREKGVLTVIDNTWGAGVLLKPMTLGVDVSIQALTKYVCGHSDVFMGSAVANGEVAAQLARSHYEIGWSVSPDDAYLAIRGLRTLHTRLAQHGANALEVATWLAQQPEVRQVLCPALPDCPGHDLWRRDFTGICGLFGAVLKPTSEASVSALMEELKLFGLGFSWGGFESLALPCDPQLPARVGVKPPSGPLIRLHIGLEDPADLIADLRRGLDRLTAQG